MVALLGRSRTMVRVFIEDSRRDAGAHPPAGFPSFSGHVLGAMFVGWTAPGIECQDLACERLRPEPSMTRINARHRHVQGRVHIARHRSARNRPVSRTDVPVRAQLIARSCIPTVILDRGRPGQARNNRRSTAWPICIFDVSAPNCSSFRICPLPSDGRARKSRALSSVCPVTRTSTDLTNVVRVPWTSRRWSRFVLKSHDLRSRFCGVAGRGRGVGRWRQPARNSG